MSFYNHELKCDTEESPIQILMNGNYTDWNTAKSTIIDKPDCEGVPSKISGTQIKWPWKYGKLGLQNEDLFVWNESTLEDRAFVKEKYRQAGKYLFSYCVFHSTKGPRTRGDHAYIRLITPEGKIYEFGKYRPLEISGRETILIKHDEVITNPESSTSWPTPQR